MYSESLFQHKINMLAKKNMYNIYIYKNNKKTFSMKLKENVGMSKPKKQANKVGNLT